MTLQRFESSWIKSLVFKWQNLCMSVWNIVDLRSLRIVSLTGTLICHCLKRIGKVKCMTRFLLISEEFLRSKITSAENGTSLSAHGAQVAPSGRPLGGANL
jgi:hypothetical protein